MPWKIAPLYRQLMLAFASAFIVPTALLQPVAAQTANAPFVPDSAIALMGVDFDQIQKHPELEALPWEVVSAMGEEQVGIDPLVISSAKIAVGLPGPEGPEFAVLIETSKEVDIANLNNQVLGEVTVPPRRKSAKYRKFNDGPMQVVQTGPTSVMVGTNGMLRQVLAGVGDPSPLNAIIDADKEPIRLAISVDAVRPLASGMLEQNIESIPEPLQEDARTILSEVQYLYVRSTLGTTAEFTMHVIGRDADGIAKIEETMEHARMLALEQIETIVRQEVANGDMSDKVREAWSNYITRFKTILTKVAKPVREENRLTMQLKDIQSVSSIGVLTGLLLPAVQAAREAARRMQSTNNLKQMALAMHNYESAYRRFPGRSIKDKEGTPLLSWRVAILPYIEQGQLYQEFHMDEPWDSEHNIKLLDRMPEIYRHPSSQAAPNLTVYVAPFNGGTVWDLEKPRFADITDGTSNTIMLVEVNDQAAVPWTKPDDLDLEEVDLLEVFGGHSVGGGNTAFCDGSVRFIATSINEEILKAILTCAGGEVVDTP